MSPHALTGLPVEMRPVVTYGIEDMITDQNPAVSSEARKLLEQINSLRREDENLYSIMAVDVWALAKTMDEFQPGFWTAFMKNREKAIKRFMSEAVRRKSNDAKSHPFFQ